MLVVLQVHNDDDHDEHYYHTFPHHNHHYDHHNHQYHTGKVDLYVGKEVVRRAIPNELACDELVSLIKEYGRWIDPRPVEEASPSSSSKEEVNA